ncbi:MAG: hypothetical protein V1775_05090 [Bacteroidota bacterium]
MKLLLLITGFLMLLSACKDENNIADLPLPEGPTLSGISLSADNKHVSVDFSEPVYKGGALNMAVGNEDLTIILAGGQALLDSFRIIHTAGQEKADITLFLRGVANGSETLSVKPSGNQTIVNAAARAMKETEQLSIALADIGIIGSWVSTGENLSPVFQQFGFDSVYMEYKGDGSYLFESFTSGGIHNILTGTYLQNISMVEGIRLITLSQADPVLSTIQGIFSLQNGNPVAMTYETVQTDPAIEGLTPPSPESGFGSSGLLGSDNIQIFIRQENW